MAEPAVPAVRTAHWSGVARGESFTVKFEYDRKKYESSHVFVSFRRNLETGLTESADGVWEWAVKSVHGEGRAKAVTAARASGLFTPPLVGLGSYGTQAGLRGFFSPKPAASSEPSATPEAPRASPPDGVPMGSESPTAPPFTPNVPYYRQDAQVEEPRAKRQHTPFEAMSTALASAGLDINSTSRVRDCPGNPDLTP